VVVEEQQMAQVPQKVLEDLVVEQDKLLVPQEVEIHLL
tara:strand:+ start:35 stop:148 length:114 start_codon:yes stop_codon:yes gene_type:complete